MNAELTNFSTPRHCGDYRAGWIIAFSIAILFAPFVIIFQHSAPWLIVFPIGIGAAIILFSEWKNSGVIQFESDFFESIPEGFHGLSAYSHLWALEIHPPRKASKNQLALFESFPETTSINSIRTLYDKNNHEIAVINCDRYSALLVSYLIDN